jgi:DNA-binding NtrC family response regulator
MARLLLIEDERLLRWALRARLQAAGHVVDDAATLQAASDQLKQQRPDVVLLDVNLPDGNGIEFLEAERERLSESTVIVFTADGRIEDAVRAMRSGAWDFISKPVDHEELLRLIQRATVQRLEKLEAEVSRRAREKQNGSAPVAESAGMKEVLRLAATVAASGSTTVLLQGETGAGKEVVARFIHMHSPRANAPLQALNCAALPETLVESELFGYEKGAFTDAKGSRRGLFELADGGTVVLDEVGELPLGLQAKLLRFLEERKLRRLGGARELPVDVRIIALTNRSLVERVAAGAFREDLFYRLNVFPITVPPLRARREDILPLANSFARHFAGSCGKKISGLSPELEQRLLDSPWTGNVRELRNLIERAVILAAGEVLSPESISLPSAAPPAPAAPISDGVVPLEEIELLMVQRALRAANGNQSQAARMLQVSRDQLRYRVKRYRELGRLDPGLVVEFAGGAGAVDFDEAKAETR